MKKKVVGLLTAVLLLLTSVSCSEFGLPTDSDGHGGKHHATPTPCVTPATPTPTPLAACTPSPVADRGVGGLAGILAPNQVAADQFILPAGTVKSFLINVASNDGAGTVQMGLYSDGGGVPGVLLVQSPTQLLNNGWNTVPIPSTVVGAGSYWLAFQLAPGVSPGTVFLPLSKGVPGSTLNITNSNPFGVLPSSFGAGNPTSEVFSIDVNECVSP